MRKKILLFILSIFLTSQIAFAAWNPDQPENNELLETLAADIRANWDAIELGTDPALQITNEKVAAAAGIADTKLATISTAGKVSGAALSSLGSVPSGGGQLPIANGGTGQSTANAALNALLPSQTGNSGKALISGGTNATWTYPSSLTIASAATGDMLYYNGTAWVRLAAGTDGYYLKAKGAASPEWTAPIEGAWTDYSSSSTVTGWSSFTTKSILYKKIGKTVFVSYAVVGTSNSTAATFTLPYTPVHAVRGCGFTTNNGSVGPGGGLIIMGNVDGTVTFCPTMAVGEWTASGAKSCEGQFWFQTS